jgi:DNA-binding MarR family transcriptional regulator
MEKSRRIKRKTNALDARASIVSLTPAGRKELARAGRLLNQRLQKELRDVPASAFPPLHTGLNAISSAWMKKITSS